MSIIVNLDVVMAQRKMSLTELSEKVGLSMTNLSLLKNGRVRGMRFATLEALCRVLECQPADLLEYRAEGSAAHTSEGEERNNA